ncbi:MAG: hypothetical protein GZ094_09510 [Mariniphaga sp.]|nr:hypothetical protein [Mariniphaga sp.]
MKVFYNLLKSQNLCFKWIIFVFIGLATFSCSSLKNIGIEVAVQPEYPIGEDIQSLALLNRSMTSQFMNLKTDSLEKILINNKMSLDTVLQDSIAADTVIQTAARALYESSRFDVVVPKERNIIRTDIEEIVKPLNVSFINEICKDFNVDGVLVLESFIEQLKTNYSLRTTDGSYNNEFKAATDISYFSEWRLYRPNDLKPVIRFQIGDSIFWNVVDYSLEDVYKQMPRTKEALIGGGIAAGLKMSGYISPRWTNQTRYYYLTGKNEIDAAVPFIKNNKWEEAAAIWEKHASNSSKKIRSKVEYNLALASEMNGDLDLAIEWGLKSFKSKYSKAIEVYLKTLDNKRIAQLKENKKRY